MEVSIQKQSNKKSIEPSDPVGYYHIFEEKTGQYYLCFEGTMTNLSDGNMDVKNIDVIGTIGSDEYKGIVRLESEGGKDLISEIGKGETLPIIIFFQLDTDVKEKPKEMILRFDENLRKPTKEQTYVYETTLKL